MGLTAGIASSLARKAQPAKYNLLSYAVHPPRGRGSRKDREKQGPGMRRAGASSPPASQAARRVPVWFTRWAMLSSDSGANDHSPAAPGTSRNTSDCAVSIRGT